LTGKQEYLVSLQRYFGSIEADWQMGLALFEQGRPAEAVKYLERFVQAVPELRRGMIYLAVASGAAGETLQGADLYMRATANRPDPVMLEASVLKLFADLVRIQPDNAEAHYRHGIVLAQFGHFREGVAAVDRAFVLAPTEEIARSRVRLRGYLP
jgi:tetratricopeptide (TPR) repeat protein